MEKQGFQTVCTLFGEKAHLFVHVMKKCTKFYNRLPEFSTKNLAKRGCVMVTPFI